MTTYSFNLNAQDLRNEAKIMDCFMRSLDNERFTAEKITEATPDEWKRKLDYRILMDGKVVGYAEVKRRNLSLKGISRLGGLFLSKKKYKTLQEKTPNARCIYIAGLNDAVGYHSINDDTIVEEFVGGGGATNRNSPDDYEEMVVFDPKQFKVVSERIPDSETNPA